MEIIRERSISSNSCGCVLMFTNERTAVTDKAKEPIVFFTETYYIEDEFLKHKVFNKSKEHIFDSWALSMENVCIMIMENLASFCDEINTESEDAEFLFNELKGNIEAIRIINKKLSRSMQMDNADKMAEIKKDAEDFINSVLMARR